MQCLQCGSQNAAESKFCASCGSDLAVGNGGNVKIEDALRAFVGKNADYYLNKWGREDVARYEPTFNWAAFLYTYFWFAYRKMYAIAFLLGALAVLSSLVCQKYMVSQAFQVGYYITLLSVMMGISISANSLYRFHAERKIRTAMKSTGGEEKVLNEIRRQGGTNKLAVLVALLVLVIPVATVNSINLIIDPVRDELIRYVQTDIPTMEKLQKTMITNHDRARMDLASQQIDMAVLGIHWGETLQSCHNYAQETSNVESKLSVKEVVALHELLVDSANKACSGMVAQVNAIDRNDLNGMSAANDLLIESQKLHKQWKGKLQEMVKEHRVELSL